MANKIINFDNYTDKKEHRTAVYSDVSMIADFDRKSVFGNKYKVGKNIDVEAVKVSMRHLFTWELGERVLDPEYGNTLRKFLFEGITDFTNEQIIAEITRLVNKYEPRAAIDKLTPIRKTENAEHNKIVVLMVWHPIGIPTRQYEQEIVL